MKARRRNHGLHRAPSLHAVVLVAAFSYATLTGGAFFGRALLVFETMIAVSLIAAFAVEPPRRTDISTPVSFAVALVMTSTALSAVASGRGLDAVPEMLFLVSLYAIVLVVMRLSAADRDLVVRGLAALAVLVAVVGWLGVAFHSTPEATMHGPVWRASSTITYANATGGFLVLVALLLLGRLVVEPRNILAAVTSYLVLLGLGATLSRGSAVALLIGLITLAAIAGPRRTFRGIAPVALAFVIGFAGLAPSFPVSAPARPAVAVAGVFVGALVLVATIHGRSRILVYGSVATVVVVAIVAMRFAPAIAEVVGGRFAGDVGVRDRLARWDDFLGIAADHLLVGAGPGGFLLRYPGAARLDVGRYAHNEYLQTLAEKGVVGLAAVIAGCLVIGRNLWRRRTTHWTWIGGSAALTAFLIQSATDFLWNVPIIPALAAALVGLASDLPQPAELPVDSVV